MSSYITKKLTIMIPLLCGGLLIGLTSYAGDTINVPGLESDLASVPDRKPHVLDISTYGVSRHMGAAEYCLAHQVETHGSLRLPLGGTAYNANCTSGKIEFPLELAYRWDEPKLIESEKNAITKRLSSKGFTDVGDLGIGLYLREYEIFERGVAVSPEGIKDFCYALHSSSDWGEENGLRIKGLALVCPAGTLLTVDSSTDFLGMPPALVQSTMERSGYSQVADIDGVWLFKKRH